MTAIGTKAKVRRPYLLYTTETAAIEWTRLIKVTRLDQISHDNKRKIFQAFYFLILKKKIMSRKCAENSTATKDKDDECSECRVRVNF